MVVLGVVAGRIGRLADRVCLVDGLFGFLFILVRGFGKKGSLCLLLSCG